MSTKAKDRKVKGKKAKTTAIEATTASARKVKNGDFASLVEAKKTSSTKRWRTHALPSSRWRNRPI